MCDQRGRCLSPFPSISRSVSPKPEIPPAHVSPPPSYSTRSLPPPPTIQFSGRSWLCLPKAWHLLPCQPFCSRCWASAYGKSQCLAWPAAALRRCISGAASLGGGGRGRRGRRGLGGPRWSAAAAAALQSTGPRIQGACPPSCLPNLCHCALIPLLHGVLRPCLPTEALLPLACCAPLCAGTRMWFVAGLALLTVPGCEGGKAARLCPELTAAPSVDVLELWPTGLCVCVFVCDFSLKTLLWLLQPIDVEY